MNREDFFPPSGKHHLRPPSISSSPSIFSLASRSSMLSSDAVMTMRNYLLSSSSVFDLQPLALQLLVARCSAFHGCPPGTQIWCLSNVSEGRILIERCLGEKPALGLKNFLFQLRGMNASGPCGLLILCWFEIQIVSMSNVEGNSGGRCLS